VKTRSLQSDSALCVLRNRYHTKYPPKEEIEVVGAQPKLELYSRQRHLNDVHRARVDVCFKVINGIDASMEQMLMWPSND